MGLGCKSVGKFTDFETASVLRVPVTGFKNSTAGMNNTELSMNSTDFG
jgi:hypothetical protein